MKYLSALAWPISATSAQQVSCWTELQGPAADPPVGRAPTKMAAAQLTEEGYYSVFGKSGARMEIPGCSLCMG